MYRMNAIHSPPALGDAEQAVAELKRDLRAKHADM